MRVGIVILPEHRWWAAEPRWRAAETYGFDHAWTYDHLGWRSLVDGPWFDSMATLTAAAMVTETIRLGTLVVSPHFRHPVPFTRQVLSLDDISDGRFMLGLGSGASGKGGYDRSVMGEQEITPAQVTARFGEFVELMDTCLSRPVADHSGEFYTAVAARNAPGCVQRPRVPFLIAANGPKAMALAAKFGQGWVTTGPPDVTDLEDWWRGVARLSGQFDKVLAEHGRDRSTVDRYVSLDASPLYSMTSVEAFRDHLGRARELGFTDVVTHWPREHGVYAGRESVLEQIADDVLPELRSAGQGSQDGISSFSSREAGSSEG